MNNKAQVPIGFTFFNTSRGSNESSERMPPGIKILVSAIVLIIVLCVFLIFASFIIGVFNLTQTGSAGSLGDNTTISIQNNTFRATTGIASYVPVIASVIVVVFLTLLIVGIVTILKVKSEELGEARRSMES